VKRPEDIANGSAVSAGFNRSASQNLKGIEKHFEKIV
jgi:hypothetical protein